MSDKKQHTSAKSENNEQIEKIDIPEELKDELLGDLVPTIDPEKLFDENEYSTLVLGSENTIKKDTDSIHAIEVLISKTSSREEKDEALIQLKENKAQGVLVNAIEQVKKAEQKAQLVAACWETGLDFGNYFLHFITLTIQPDYIIALEALTVLQEMEADIDTDRLQKALVQLQKSKNQSDIVMEAIALVEGRLSAK